MTDHIARIYVPKTSGTYYEFYVKEIKFSHVNTIIQIPIPKSQSRQGTGSQPQNKVIDLKRITNTVTLTCVMEAEGSDTAYERCFELWKLINEQKGAVSGNSQDCGNMKLVIRGNTFEGIVSKFDFAESFKIGQSESYDSNRVGVRQPFTFSFVITKYTVA